MKKYLIIGAILLITTSAFAGAVSVTEPNDNENNTLADFTHTVFIEEGTATWCPNCPFADGALYSMYQSGNYSFYYVALIHDMNEIAKDRLMDYVINLYKLIAFPTVYFDGGDQNMVGRAATVEATEAAYIDIVEEVGSREVKQPIDLETSVSWEGDAKITVTVDITNNGNFFYFGKIRSYVTEIESRWDDSTGNPYHFALLDFAINRPVLLMPGKTKTITATWDGAEDHGGQTYDDITSDNIMVISTISHWIPHYRTGYESDDYIQKYLAFYVDQTSAATPSI